MPHLTLDSVCVAYPMYAVSSANGDAATDSEGDSAIGGRIQRKAGRQSILALDSISLDLEGGARLGIVGHNGSGKSTLLRTMAGIYPPTAGSIRIEGSIGTLFSTGIGVQPNATGRENIILGGLLHGLTRRECESLLPAIAEFSELGPYLNFPVETYSRGMAMRLAFAMATAFEPDIVLLDEWLGAGDQRFRDKAQRRMRELVSRASIIVLASHRLPLIKENCDRCLWLEHGQMRMYGSTNEVIPLFREEILEKREAADG